MKKITDWMLKDKRDYVISKIKAPLFASILEIAFKYKEPNHENCKNFNSHFYIDLFDEIICRNQNERIDKLLKAVKRIYIGEMEHDVSYERLNDWMLQKIHEAINERKLKLHPANEYTVHWNND